MDFLCNGTINKDTFSMRCSKTSNYWRLSSLVTRGTEINTLCIRPLPDSRVYNHVIVL